MKTEREIINKKVTAVNDRLKRFNRPGITMDDYIELHDVILHLKTLFAVDWLTLREFLYASQRKDLVELMEVSEDGVEKARIIAKWLDVVASARVEKHTLTQGFAKGMSASKRRHIEAINAITEYSVKEFAKLIGVHPHTVRARFKKGELQGRQDSKGIFIAASELKKFKQLGNNTDE